MTLNDLINKCEFGIDIFRVFIDSVASLDIYDLEKGAIKQIFKDITVESYNIDFDTKKSEIIMSIYLKEVLGK